MVRRRHLPPLSLPCARRRDQNTPFSLRSQVHARLSHTTPPLVNKSVAKSDFICFSPHLRLSRVVFFFFFLSSSSSAVWRRRSRSTLKSSTGPSRRWWPPSSAASRSTRSPSTSTRARLMPPRCATRDQHTTQRDSLRVQFSSSLFVPSSPSRRYFFLFFIQG